MPLWDSINAKRKQGSEPLARAFDLLVKAGPDQATKAMEKAGRELGAGVRKGNPEAVLMSAYLLVADGEARAALVLLREHDDLCRNEGDLAYMRGEAELRSGYTALAAVRGRRWQRLARSLGVSTSVQLTALRQSAQAMILVWVGLALVALAAALRPLATSWKVVGVVAGSAIALPGLLRHLALHRVWGVVLGALFVVVAVLAVA